MGSCPLSHDVSRLTFVARKLRTNSIGAFTALPMCGASQWPRRLKYHFEAAEKLGMTMVSRGEHIRGEAATTNLY